MVAPVPVYRRIAFEAMEMRARGLRVAAISRHYIAPMLCRMPDPPPMSPWMGCSFNDESAARDSVDLWGPRWAAVPEAVMFLAWPHLPPCLRG